MTILSYVQAALAGAHYKLLDDGTYFGEIKGFQGVWAGAKTLEKCREELQEVLEEWIILKLRDRDTLPKIHGASLTIPHLLHAKAA